MRVNVFDIDGEYADTAQAGERLLALIEPTLGRNEPVVLDFEGVEHFSTVFFTCSIRLLIEADRSNRLPELLHIENLAPLGQCALDLATEYAIRRRENPRWAEAMAQAALKWSTRD